MGGQGGGFQMKTMTGLHIAMTKERTRSILIMMAALYGVRVVINAVKWRSIHLQEKSGNRDLCRKHYGLFVSADGSQLKVNRHLTVLQALYYTRISRQK